MLFSPYRAGQLGMYPWPLEKLDNKGEIDIVERLNPKKKDMGFLVPVVMFLILMAVVWAMLWHSSRGEPTSLRDLYLSDTVITTGHRSYIPFSFRQQEQGSLREDFPQIVLEIMAVFEQDHQELDVTEWKMLSEVYGGLGAKTRFLGILVDHQPRQQ